MAKKSLRVKAKARDGKVTVKALISHPMETGSRKDKDSGKVIPAHFIQEVIAMLNGDNTIFVANWGGGISKNPYLSFKFAGKKGDMLKVSWSDNKGGSGMTEVKVR